MDRPRTPTSAGTRLAAWGLIALMGLGSVLLWLGIPFAWIYGASQMVESSQPTLGPYLAVILGIPVSMVVVGKVLTRLDRRYAEVVGADRDQRVRTPWLKSMRAERDTGRPRTVLDVVMVVSVALALACFGIWFLFFAQGGGI